MNHKHLNGKGHFIDFLREVGGKIGGIIVGYQLALGVPSQGSLVVGTILIALSITLRRWENEAHWHSVYDKTPKEDVTLLGYNQKWVSNHCKDGIRLCQLVRSDFQGLDDDEWVSVMMWRGEGKEFINHTNDAPTHWRKLPI